MHMPSRVRAYALACAVWAWLAGATASPGLAMPIEETPYGKSCLRLEWRPGPQEVRDDATRQRIEADHAAGGIGGRWIAVVDPTGSAVYPSAIMPTGDPKAAENADILRRWVGEMHGRGVAVMTWIGLIVNKDAWHAHPDWRQEFLSPAPEGFHKDIDVCINSGYGDALIAFCNEALDRFGLDGVWFDGAAFTQIWDRPVPISCTCPSCRAAFRKRTGLDIPPRPDWNDPAFRRWVAWRYEMFGEYIGRVAAGIRKAHPRAAVVINHYHRPAIPWQSAIPLDRYDADIITGSEATGDASVDLVMRLCRAYGRSQSEVWRPFDTPAANPETAPQTDALLHHALGCFAAGGMPSFGGGGETRGKVAAILSPIMKAIQPYVGGPSCPQVALHVSQQTETFYLSRTPKGLGWDVEPFFGTLDAWTQALGCAHMPPDYVFDRDLRLENLRRYSLVLLPLSLALTEQQCRDALAYAQAGGTLVLGPAAGEFDEWGEPRHTGPLAHGLGFAYSARPSTDMLPRTSFVLTREADGSASPMNAFRTDLRLQGQGWKVPYRAGDQPAVAVRSFGKGRVVVLGSDFGPRAPGWQAAAGGDTSLAVSADQAESGKHSLRFVDGPNAPYVFFPDMEMRFAPFRAPERAGGQASFDLLVDEHTAATFEVRHQGGKPETGPIVNILPGGVVNLTDRTLGRIPMGVWAHFETTWRFAGAGPASYDVSVTPRGQAALRAAGMPCSAPAFSWCDWAVLYGGGKERCTFYLDNMRIVPGTDPGPDVTPVLEDDFEATEVGQTTPTNNLAGLVGDLKALAPPMAEVQAPPSVRVGFLARPGGQIVVHLRNTSGGHSDWQKPTGPPVTLRFPGELRSAELPLSKTRLAISRTGGLSSVTVPHVGVYDVVVLRR